MMQKHSKPNRGHFRKGHDARRHIHSAACGHRLYQFTHADRRAGFFAAIAIMGVSIGDKLYASGRWPNYRKAVKR